MKRLEFSGIDLNFEKSDNEDPSIANIAENLRYCNLYAGSGYEIPILFRAAPHLQQLKIYSHTPSIGMLPQVKEAFSALPILSQMRILHFEFWFSYSYDNSVNEEATLVYLERLVHSCPSLKSFQLEL